MIDTIVDQTVDYLQNWTKKEFITILNEHSKTSMTPIIAKFGDRGYLVGNYALQPIDQKWWQVSYRFDENEVKLFSSKVSAICYIFYRHSNKLVQADRILSEDNDVKRWAVKSEQYYYRYRQALKKKNSLKIDLFFTRYQETLYHLNESKSLLEKSLRSAKYFKM